MCLLRQTLIKSPSLLFMWVLLLERERKQPRMLHPRPHRVPAAWAPGPLPMYSCQSQRQGPQPSARLKSFCKHSHPSSAGCREMAPEMKQKVGGFVCFSEWLSVSLSHACTIPQLPRISADVLAESGCPLMKPHQSSPPEAAAFEPCI